MTDTRKLRGGVPNDADARVSADQETILGDGTTENPLRVNVEDGAVVVQTMIVIDGETILGDGGAENPLRTNPDGVPVAVDGETIAGNGTKEDPLRVIAPGDDGGSGGAPPLPLLPASIHGSAFRISGPANATIGTNGLVVPSQSGSVSAFAPILLPAGARISTVILRVTDNVGTPIEAHLGSEDGDVIATSQLSTADGTKQELQIDADLVLDPERSYFVNAVNPAGNLGWTLHGATIA